MEKLTERKKELTKKYGELDKQRISLLQQVQRTEEEMIKIKGAYEEVKRMIKKN